MGLLNSLHRWKANHPGAIPAPVKKLILSFTRATSMWRVLPDFVVIGAQKSGTTSLFNYIGQHPYVLPSLKKEVGGVRAREVSLPRYRAYFPSKLFVAWRRFRTGSAIITGEAHSLYLYSRLAARNASRLIPNGRFIAVLRDPVDRAISEYYHSVRKGIEQREIEEAFRDQFSMLLEERWEPE